MTAPTSPNAPGQDSDESFLCDRLTAEPTLAMAEPDRERRIPPPHAPRIDVLRGETDEPPGIIDIAVPAAWDGPALHHMRSTVRWLAQPVSIPGSAASDQLGSRFPWG